MPLALEAKSAVELLTTIHAALGTVLAAIKETEQAEDAEAVENNEEPGPAEPPPNWFKPGANRHLSPEGEAHMEALFAEGLNPYQAAKAMGVDPSAAYPRHRKWLAKTAS